MRILTCLFAVLAISSTANAHIILKKPFAKAYGYKTVSCYTCHKKGKDENGKTYKKSVRNEFGDAMAEALKDSDVSKRVKEAKANKDKDARNAAYMVIIDEVLAATKKIESKKSADGKTWGELLKAGTMEGVKK